MPTVYFFRHFKIFFGGVQFQGLLRRILDSPLFRDSTNLSKKKKIPLSKKRKILSQF